MVAGLRKVIDGKEKWDNWCSVQVSLGYMLLHGTHANTEDLVWNRLVNFGLWWQWVAYGTSRSLLHRFWWVVLAWPSISQFCCVTIGVFKQPVPYLLFCKRSWRISLSHQFLLQVFNSVNPEFGYPICISDGNEEKGKDRQNVVSNSMAETPQEQAFGTYSLCRLLLVAKSARISIKILSPIAICLFCKIKWYCI